MAKNDEMKFEIVQHFGVLKERKNGWKKEVNKVSWNDAGITFSEDEIKNLIGILKSNFEL